MHRYISFLVCSLLCSFLSAKANTEILNFDAGYSENVIVPKAAEWRVLSHAEPEQLWQVPCPHEVWALLDLDDDAWSAFLKFTLRISWAASNPADFLIETFTPSDLLRSLSVDNASAVYAEQLPQRTRQKYARIRLVDTGVRDPSSPKDGSPVVPFIIRLEPLYLGVIPASVIPTFALLLPTVIFAVVILVPRIHKYLVEVANDAREELSGKRADDSKED